MLNEISTEKILHTETLRGGQMWSAVIPRGKVLRLENTEGDAAVAGLFYNSAQPLERYNMPDTLKAQHTAHLSTGFVLYSDMGRILLSITGDSYGWHDTITGCLSRPLCEEKYGRGSYQELRNDWHRNTRDNFLVELSKVGLGKKDVVPNVNFFTKIIADEAGNLSWASEKKPGSYIDLRAEMDVLVVLSNTPHPYDPSPTYAPSPVILTIYLGEPVAEDDVCRKKRPENTRGFALTEAYNRTSWGGAA